MKASEIRTKFLEFFEQQNHHIVESSSLIPERDPTLYFVNAGMVQFKDVFVGNDHREYNRATTSQKCLRVSGKHNDLEQVGRTPRHHTFFEMLGNFSFGDYFKKEACQFAWHVLLEVFELDVEKLWITVYEKDDEAEEIWKEIGVRPERIQRLGEKDNFWSMGDTGPCGPCTEIHYDHGPEYGDDPNGPASETDRYVEIWNLVFMQFDRDTEGNLTSLPNPSIDTGMGLERLTAIKQGVYSNYDTDIFQHIIQTMAQRANVVYRDLKNPQHQDNDTALRVIADHARATGFLIADGVMPSNEGRGYVLRRIMRRAIRYGVRLGLKDPFLHVAVQCVIDSMSEAYPQLKEREDFISEVVLGEEERFSETLDKGLTILEQNFETLSVGDVLSGDVVFQLHDTYGFPVDLTSLIAEERGFGIDHKGYEQRMEHQKATGRANWKGSGEVAVQENFRAIAEQFQTDFVGYNTLTSSAVILGLYQEDGSKCESISKGESGIMITSQTPFYAEGGGQVGDKGFLFLFLNVGDVVQGNITDTQKPIGNVVFHYITITEGILEVNQTVQLEVTSSHRCNTRRNHTATHLLHAALRDILGTHVAQKGSKVDDERLRFDFSHHKAMTVEEIELVQRQVQSEIFKNTVLETESCSIELAKEKGAMALFGEKYGDEVRVVTIPGYSIELCGGTHAQATGEIGVFHILSESGVAAGIRRIEAVTGERAIQILHQRDQIISELSKHLRVNPEDIPMTFERIATEKKQLEKQIEALEVKIARMSVGDLSTQTKVINGITYISAEFTGDPKTLREEADRLRSKLGSAVVVLGSKSNGVKLIAAVTKDLVGRVHAGNLIKEIAPKIGGGGGGRPDMAQAGGKNPEGLVEALDQVSIYLQNI